jgi:predicted CxxxxCH...CXXCH cytochrome family protein
VDTDEWTARGHGNDTLTSFITKAGGGDACLWCHDKGAAHDIGSSNPFRLKGQQAGIANLLTGADAWNYACLICHDTGETGTYDAGEGFTPLNRAAGGDMSSRTKIDKWHQLSAHSASGVNGGQFCWDCHDPHGDTASQILMVQKRPAKTTDGTYGIPATTPGTDVNFINNSLATGAGGFAKTSAQGTPEEGLCNTCHTYSASAPKMEHYYSAGSDGASDGEHNSGTLCTTCHTHSNDTTNNGSAFAGAGCTGCHNGPPAVGAHPTHVTAEPSSYGDYTNGSNASQYEYGCGKCHDGTGHPNQDNGSGTNGDPWITNVVFDQTTDPEMSGLAVFTRGTEQGPEQGPNNEWFSYTNGTCSNVYCHGDFTGGNNATPTWTGAAACGTCHNASAATPPSGGAHAEHVGSGAGEYQFACYLCHEATVDATPSISNKSKHVDGAATWDLDITNSRVGASATYSGTEAGAKNPPSATYGSCLSVTCHTSDGVSGAPNVVAGWGDGTQGCAYCHNSGSAMATSAHNEHVNQAAYLGDNFGCVDCHSGTVSGDTTVSSPSTHIDMDGTADVAGTNVGTYSAGSCTTSYCHSSGQETTAYEDPGTWSAGTLANDCKGCHGTTSSTSGEPDYSNGGAGTNTANSHAKHDRASTTDCNKCHDLVVNGSGNLFSGSEHLNGAANASGAAIGSYNASTETCSTVTCHTDGKGGTPNDNTIVWGETPSGAACTYCHDSNAAATPDIMATDAHTAHVNQSAYLGDNFGCAVCHSQTVSGDTTISTAANHLDMDGTAEVTYRRRP